MSKASPQIRIKDWGPEDLKRAEMEFWGEMLPFVSIEVAKSFEAEDTSVRNFTRAVVKERTDMAKSLVEELRKGRRWSKPRIKTLLPQILRAKLIGLELDLDRMGSMTSY